MPSSRLIRTVADRYAPRAELRATELLRRSLGTVVGVTTTDPVVGLSFDDGPDPANTERVLEMLRGAGFTATFFVLVEHARRHVTLLDAMRGEGHEIALHGAHHVDLTRCSPWRLVEEIHRAHGELENLIGAPVTYFRPPYGTKDLAVHVVARLSRLTLVAWSASPRDFLDLDTERHLEIVANELAPGGIVLLHDGRSARAMSRSVVHRAVLDLMGERDLRGETVGGLLAGRTAVRRVAMRSREEALLDEIAPLLGGRDPEPATADPAHGSVGDATADAANDRAIAAVAAAVE